MDYSKKLRSELITICKDNNIKGYSNKTKNDIIELIISSNICNNNNVSTMLIAEQNITINMEETNEKIDSIIIKEEKSVNSIIYPQIFTKQFVEINKIYNKDCITGMKNILDNSADIIICDPPYNIGKDFGNDSDRQTMDNYLKWCDVWIAECLRILKPTGTLYIYGFSEILAFIRTRITCNVRWLIWHYTNKVTPSLNFWQRTHESILCCYKGKPTFNRDDVREPYTESFLKNAAGKVRKSTKGRFSSGEKETIYNAHDGGALPRDVIKVAALSGGAGKKERVDHPTQKPLSLCDTLLKASLNRNSQTLLVVPFAGSGSECVSAKNNNVDFIGFELNGEYVEIANNRLREIDI